MLLREEIFAEHLHQVLVAHMVAVRMKRQLAGQEQHVRDCEQRARPVQVLQHNLHWTPAEHDTLQRVHIFRARLHRRRAHAHAQSDTHSPGRPHPLSSSCSINGVWSGESAPQPFSSWLDSVGLPSQRLALPARLSGLTEWRELETLLFRLLLSRKIELIGTAVHWRTI